MSLTVSQVARLAGVSVRTLHHYDEIGLLQPSGRSEARYRLWLAAFTRDAFRANAERAAG